MRSEEEIRSKAMEMLKKVTDSTVDTDSEEFKNARFFLTDLLWVLGEIGEEPATRTPLLERRPEKREEVEE